MIADPHDKRSFRRWLRFNDDGTVASVHEVEASVNQPFAGAVEVTDDAPKDFTAIVVSKSDVALLRAGTLGRQI